MSDDTFLRNAGAVAGKGTGGFWGGTLGFVVASVFFPPLALVGAVVGVAGGAAVGSSAGRENPEVALGCAAATALITGGASIPAMGAIGVTGTDGGASDS